MAEMIARVRVYLFTYDRDMLLKRALDSLLSQTFTDWVCELHNDKPGNIYPSRLIENVDDPRIILVDHPENLGPVRSFDLAFHGCDEEYISILEDDNWWEPQFLAKMLYAMESKPSIRVGWSNMWLHREGQEGDWQALNKSIWPLENEEMTLFDRSVGKQAFGALHSIGAMLIRNVDLGSLRIPAEIRSDFIEPIRERAFLGQLVLVREPLANFAITRHSSRPTDRNGIHEHYFLLLASFFRQFGRDSNIIDAIWTEMRKSRVRNTHNLIYTGVCDRSCRSLLSGAVLSDWIFFIAYNLRYPLVVLAFLNAKRKYPELWQFLLSKNNK